LHISERLYGVLHKLPYQQQFEIILFIVTTDNLITLVTGKKYYVQSNNTDISKLQ
jgi:hypothetical protein